MAISSTVLPRANYPAMFREYIFRSANYILDKIEETTDSFPTDQQELALHTLPYTFKLPEAWPLTRKLVLLIAPKMEQAGYRDDWMAYLESGIKQSQQLGDAQAEAEVRFYLGELYQYQAKYPNARTHLEASATYFEQVGNLHYQARALNRLAGVVRRQGNLEEARELAERGLVLSAENKTEQGFSYLVLGAIAFNQRDWQEANDYLEKSLALWEETNNKRLIGWGLTNLGRALRALKKYDDAIKCYQQAIHLFETIQDPGHQAVVRMNLGNVYLELDLFSDALASYLEAEPIFRRTQNRLCLAKVNNNKGMAYQKLQEFNRAKQAYNTSIDVWQQLNRISSLVNSIDSLGSVYLEQKLYEKAERTFQDALKWLAQIENHPRYNYLLTTVSTHLRQAENQSTPSPEVP